jgi:hypothetical protein
MGFLTVQGVYRDGKIELSERPEHVDEAAPVLVTFLPTSKVAQGVLLREGQDREDLRQRAFARMKAGIHLGGPPYPKREDLYDRQDR